jgi:hypothetical protein
MHRMAEGRAHPREIDMLLEITYVTFPPPSSCSLSSPLLMLLATSSSWVLLIQ